MQYRIKDNIIWKLVENELVIVKTDTDEYMYLNPTGADIFEMISKGMMSDEIKRELILRYDALEETINSDFKDIVKELKASGIIEDAV